MPRFRYIVINTENKQLQGTIGAPSEADARRELGELGFSIISLQTIEEENNSTNEDQNLKVFEFTAIDKNNKRVAGTIQSQDSYSAYKRLVTEYSFVVESIVDQSLSLAEKEKERQKGIFELQSRLEEEQALSQVAQNKDTEDLQDFAQRQEVLQQQIQFVLHKVKEMLDQYEHDITPETKEKIRIYIQKLLRIKNSTNLDYIRKTAEDLLLLLQKEELFLSNDARIQDRTKMLVAAKTMMMQLRKAKNKKSLSFIDKLQQWREAHINKNPSPTFVEKLLNSFISLIIGSNEVSPDILEKQRALSLLNSQIRQYFVLLFQAPTPEFKQETKESLRRLFNERKKLKHELELLKKKQKKSAKTRAELSTFEKLGYELLTLSGWVLTFYLIYYFIAQYGTSKDFGNIEFPFLFSIYRSHFLKYFLLTVFSLHCFLSIKFYFFRRNEVATLIMVPLFFIGMVVLYLNV